MFKVLPGKRPATFRYLRGGYTYHRDTYDNNIHRCSTRSSTHCVRKLKVNAEETDVIKEEEHDWCAADENLITREILILECVRRAENSTDEFSHIFETVSRE